jgi:hypothetical protein
MDLETWKHGDMKTWRHGDMETWRHGDMETWRHGDMETWRHAHGYIKQKTKNGSTADFPYSIYRLLIVLTEVCHFLFC